MMLTDFHATFREKVCYLEELELADLGERQDQYN